VTATLRPARVEDASDMVVLTDIAGHGLPLWIWRRSAAEEGHASVLEAARGRARREESDFSWRHATIADVDGAIAGMLVGYRQPDTFDRQGWEGLPDVLRPLVELEAEAPGSWYVNILAVYPEHRGEGVGALLMGHADLEAAATKANGLSLIAEDTNQGARRLYRRLGFEDAASRAYVGFDQGPAAERWILMVKN